MVLIQISDINWTTDTVRYGTRLSCPVQKNLSSGNIPHLTGQYDCTLSSDL